MTEMVTSGSMSGEEKRSDGLLGESGNERRRSHQAPPVLHATALLLDSTRHAHEDNVFSISDDPLVVGQARESIARGECRKTPDGIEPHSL